MDIDSSFLLCNNENLRFSYVETESFRLMTLNFRLFSSSSLSCLYLRKSLISVNSLWSWSSCDKLVRILDFFPLFLLYGELLEKNCFLISVLEVFLFDIGVWVRYWWIVRFLLVDCAFLLDWKMISGFGIINRRWFGDDGGV